MKQNLIVFLADLFNVIEIHPVKCVKYPGMDKFTGQYLSSNTLIGVFNSCLLYYFY